MEQKSLLYIDILGFSNLVRENPTEVRRIYNIIENLNCHHHDAFKTIVFSDTILVYNIDDYLWETDKKYFVQYQIEFAHNLFNEFAGKGYHFKALLLDGEFENTQPKNIERYFGKVFVDAYQDQKKINCMGLFIEKNLNKHNKFYITRRFNAKYNFVYLTQSLEVLKDEYGFEIPIEKYIIDDTDYPYDLIRYTYYFKNLYQNIEIQKDNRTKKKYIKAYSFYKKRYKKFITQLENNNFDPNSICNGISWNKFEHIMKDGIGGFGITPPTLKKFKDIIEKARSSGKNAVINFCEKKYKTTVLENLPFLPCGGAWIVLDVKTNTKLGKFLLSSEKELNRVSIDKTYNENSIRVAIYDMYNTQAKILDEVANNAALNVLKNELDVEGYVHVYWD